MKVIGKSKRGFIKPKPVAKIYCAKCRYHQRKKAPRGSSHECWHPEILETKDTPIEVAKKPGKCMELNKCNDCPLFKAIS